MFSFFMKRSDSERELTDQDKEEEGNQKRDPRECKHGNRDGKAKTPEERAEVDARMDRMEAEEGIIMQRPMGVPDFLVEDPFCDDNTDNNPELVTEDSEPSNDEDGQFVSMQMPVKD